MLRFVCVIGGTVSEVSNHTFVHPTKNVCYVAYSVEIILAVYLTHLTPYLFIFVAEAGASGTPVLISAGDESAVLPGVVQRRVLQAAQDVGLQVLSTPPNSSQRHTWREAFITNWCAGFGHTRGGLFHL